MYFAKSPYRAVSKYPPSSFDLTFEVVEGNSSIHIERRIQAVSDLIWSTELIDVWREGLGYVKPPGEGLVSYTFRIVMIHLNRTLVKDDIQDVRRRIISVVEELFEARCKD